MTRHDPTKPVLDRLKERQGIGGARPDCATAGQGSRRRAVPRTVAVPGGRDEPGLETAVILGHPYHAQIKVSDTRF
jgi:hypothetical protein